VSCFRVGWLWFPEKESVVALIAVATALWASCSSSGAPLSDPVVDSYNVHVGTQTFAGLYQFTTNTMLVETAQAIAEMGSDTIKLYLGSNYPRQYRYDLAQAITNLVTLSRDDASCRRVLDMPFNHIIAWAYPFSNPDAPFEDGTYTLSEQANDYRELYDLAQYLLTRYNNSGKTFYLGHWEGDGYLNVNNWSTNPSPAVIQGMISWENNRQKAVDDAKAATTYTNVNVFYYAEVNRVRDAMLNDPTNNQRVINTVVPYLTNLDFLSYSSYDAMDLDATSLYTTLDYVKSKLPSTKASLSLGQRVWIGEYGWGTWSTAAQEPASRAYIQRLLNWAPRFILFWEIYNNETDHNFCLIDSNAVKVPSYFLHQRFINQARLTVAQFKETQSRVPTDFEFAALMAPALSLPLSAPKSLVVSNLGTSVSGNSAVVSGRIAQGTYGDEQAAVWLYWGRQDGGAVRTNWESGRMLGVNTNFNAATFSTTISGLQPQTNYYFRFYVTNSTGEAWAPESAVFSTQTIRPGDYGCRMKVSLSGYHRAQALTEFPMLIVLSTNLDGFQYSHFAAEDGEDLRFTDAGGSLLIPHEIDEWNTNGASLVWVQVPYVTGTNDFIWGYWGNPFATNSSAGNSSDSVWQPSYQAVWHLKQTSVPYLDSAQHYPILSGSAPETSAGMIGHGVHFDGSAQYLDAGTLNLGTRFTFSAWVKVDPDANGIQTICANKKGGWNTDGFALFVNTYRTSDQKLILESGNGTSGLTASTAANLVTPGVWHHVVAVVDKVAASAHLYVDGIDETQSSWVQSDFASEAELNLGRFSDGSYYFKGVMDEIRIEQALRPADWIWADWMVVAQNRSLIEYAAATLQPVLLSVTSSKTVAEVRWAASGVGLALYGATNLAFPTFWTRVTNLSSLAAGEWKVVLPPTTMGTRFLRLQAN
jgi:hypothetical protein